jgi:hypothetical protein
MTVNSLTCPNCNAKCQAVDWTKNKSLRCQNCGKLFGSPAGAPDTSNENDLPITSPFQVASAANVEVLQPQQIGRYRVVKILGKGGFGTVYLAHDDDLDRKVAIKVPRPDRVP